MSEENQSVQAGQQLAILLELETMAVNGRQIMYDVLKSVLADKGVKLSVAMFSRYCLDKPITEYLEVLLKASGKKVSSEDKLMAEISQGIRLSLADGAVKLNAGAKKLMREAGARGVVVGFLSLQDEKTSQQLVSKLGSAGSSERLFAAAGEDRGCPTPDGWLKLAKTLSVPSSICLVVTTSSASCKAALSAGMRCVVLPDSFTEFQDFGGADVVLDSLDDEGLERVFALLAG